MRISTSQNIHLSCCHLVGCAYLSRCLSSSYLVIGKKECEPGRQCGISISDKTPLQAQLWHTPAARLLLYFYFLLLLNLPTHRLLIFLNPDYSRVTLIPHRCLQVSTNESGPRPFPSPCISMFSHIPNFVRPYAA